MPIYNLLEYSKNYRKTIGSLYNYYRDELTNDNNNNFANRNVVNSNAFKYKNKIIGNMYSVDAAAAGYDGNKNGTQEVKIAIPLKCLGNFWRALNIPLICCEVSLELKWNKNCIITSLKGRQLGAGPPVVRDCAPTGASLAINDCKLYIPVVTLSKDFDLPIKTEEEAFEKIIDISRNNEYTTGNLLDHDYFKKYYKLIAIDLSKQQVLQGNEDLIQQINFI